MNISQLKGKCRRIRDDQEEEQEVSGELNVVPYLDVVTNIVMFLLANMTAYQVAFGNMNITAPSRAEGGGAGESEPKEELNLTVLVTEKGFTITGRGATIPNPKTLTTPTLPTFNLSEDVAAARRTELRNGKVMWCPEELQLDWDYKELSRMLSADFKYKADAPPEHRNETKIIVMANQGMCYNVVVHTMDAVRRDAQNRVLFPDIVLSAGVQ